MFTKHFMNGWGIAVKNPINVNKIATVEIHKRLFCILDDDYPFTLRIKYYNPGVTNIPIIIGNHGIYNMTNYKSHDYMTLRFKSQNDAQYEMDKINKLKLLINLYNLKIEEDIKKSLIE